MPPPAQTNRPYYQYYPAGAPHNAITNAPPRMPQPEQPALAPPPTNNYPGKSLGFQPIIAPPLPISARQQAELQQLLQRYQANEITPAQYQERRAKILSGH
jgi:hypothetical protein